MTTLHERDALRDRSTGDLVKDLSHQASTLVRQEIDLAKAEMAEKGRRAGVGVGLLAGAAVAGLLALGALTAFLTLALDEGMPPWAAALVVTVAWVIVAAGLAYAGREKVNEVGTPVPEKTIESVKEDVEWLKGQTR